MANRVETLISLQDHNHVSELNLKSDLKDLKETWLSEDMDVHMYTCVYTYVYMLTYLYMYMYILCICICMLNQT